MFKYLLYISFSLIALPAAAQDSICGTFYSINPPSEPTFMTPRCQEQGNTLYVDGLIDENLTYELKLRPHVTHLELNSYGGKIIEAYEVAQIVRERGMTTNVRKGAKCASACTLIFQAGVYRSAHPEVRFLYHGVRRPYFFSDWAETCRMKSIQECANKISQVIEESKIDNATMFNEYVKYGMPSQFWNEYLTLKESDQWLEDGNFLRTENWIIGAPELLTRGIIHSLSQH